MKYNEVDWDRIKERQQAWLSNQLDDHLILIAAETDWATSAGVDGKLPGVDPRPHTHEEVKRWFMDPEVRMRRELTMARNGKYFGDAFPSIDIPRINIMQAAYYGAEPEYTHHTVYVPPLLADGWEGWEERVRFSENNEVFQLTLAQARKAVELAGDDIAITMIGGFEGPLDNTATVRGTENALLDVLENPDQVLGLEHRFLDDFSSIYFRIYEVIDGHGAATCLWNRVLCVDGPAHVMQSDFSCMISAEQYEDLGKWYLDEQSSSFAHTIYHLDGANAAHHIPMLAGLPKLDCIQFIHNHHGGDLLINEQNLDIILRILETGKTCEVFTWHPEEVVPLLKQLPARGMKIYVTAATEDEAADLEQQVKSLGYLKE